tara:strand:+ start:3004 stop:3279 length:276 start_codon:yes stop_codon:yes gene_type:complete
MEVNKLSAEELKNLQELNQSFTAKKMNIADTVYQQQSLVKELDEIKDRFSVVEKALGEKYGKDAIVDLSNGDVKYPEDVVSTEEDTNTETE